MSVYCIKKGAAVATLLIVILCLLECVSWGYWVLVDTAAISCSCFEHWRITLHPPLLQRKLLPEYLLNWWPSCYSAGCWNQCPSLWSNEYSSSRKVISIERKAKTTFIQMNTCWVWFESQWRRPFWIFRSKLKKGKKINQNWDTFSCSSAIPK